MCVKNHPFKKTDKWLDRCKEKQGKKMRQSASSATCHFPWFRTFQKKEQGLDIISKRRAKILVNFDLRLSKTTIMFSIF